MMKGTLIWLTFVSLFLGFIVGGVIIGNIFPQSFKITAPLVCDGDMTVTTRDYSYKPGQSGRETIANCQDSVTGENRRITGAAFFVYSLIFSAGFFIIFVANMLIKRLRGKTQGLEPASAAPPVPPVMQVRASRSDLSGSSPLETLTKLKQLRDANLINEEEYQAKKAEILAKL